MKKAKNGENDNVHWSLKPSNAGLGSVEMFKKVNQTRTRPRVRVWTRVSTAHEAAPHFYGPGKSGNPNQ